MSPVRGKLKLIRETVKENHTPHWDLDMLSWEELDTLLQEQSSADDTLPSPPKHAPETGPARKP